MRGAKYARDVINDRVSLYSTTSSISLSGIKPLRRKHADNLHEIEPTPDSNSSQSVLDCTLLETDGKGNIIDPKSGRRIILKGINLDASSKLPTVPDMPTYKGNPDDPNDLYFDGDNVSFVGRPFPLEEAESHFQRIKSWGYNTIRFILTWEALEHKGPGIYDEDFIDYTIKILEVINKVGGIYVFLEMHQDTWSRYSGGSGAPLWTFYAAGLEPKRFTATEAALLHNEPRFHDPDNPEVFPKMIWPSNYKRLACLTMFTLFFGGATFFPQLKIDGVNIQHYLQSKFLNSVGHLWDRVTKALPHMLANGSLLGFESLNEPNGGLIGHEHLGYLPASQQLRVGTTPTVYQCMKLGMGFPIEVDVYKITMTGPQKDGSRIVDPKGVRVWLSPREGAIIDAHYGWKRSPEWKLGQCIFYQRHIWKWSKDLDLHDLPNMTQSERLQLSAYKCELRFPNFFNQINSEFNLKSEPLPKKINAEYFINNFFVDYYLDFKKTIRDITPNIFVLMQPPVLEIPPNLKTDSRHVIDSKTIYAPHYYDGVSLMFKTWNTKYNVDTLGIMRCRYFNPVLGIVFGERAIRNCLKKQFLEIKRECEEYLGSIPVLMSETGMPFDMDDKRAYADGKYYSQTGALDGLSYALEGSNMSHTYWCYSSLNCHKWGDRWNNEDFSFWSPDDRNLQFEDDANESDADDDKNNLMTARRRPSLKSSVKAVQALKANTESLKLKSKIQRKTRANLRQSRRDSRRGVSSNLGSEYSSSNGSNGFEGLDINARDEDTQRESTPGDAGTSPEKQSDDNTDTQSIQSSTLISTTSENVKFRHNRKCYPSPDGVRAVGAVIRPFVVATRGIIKVSEFDLKSVRFALTVSFKDSTDEGADSTIPTVIFLPKWHYPYLNYGDIYLTSGTVKYNEQLEYLEWYHNDDGDDDEGSINEGSVNESVPNLNKEETIIIKNNSGSLDDLKPKDRNGLLAYAAENGCPVS